MRSLVPCRACNRHVRGGAACPFCGASRARGLSAGNDEPATSSIGRSSRAALLAFAATAAACDHSQATMYGGPPTPVAVEPAQPDAALSASAAPVAPPQTSQTVQVTAYGGPPMPTASAPQVVPKR